MFLSKKTVDVKWYDPDDWPKTNESSSYDLYLESIPVLVKLIDGAYMIAYKHQFDDGIEEWVDNGSESWILTGKVSKWTYLEVLE